MSCIFCSSNYHLSHNCDIYISNEERQNILRSKNRCTQCLKANCDFLYFCNEFNRKCYICFAKNHHTVYCPNRFTVPNMFVPKIDELLLPRFMEALKIEEKLLLMLLSGKLSKPVVISNKHVIDLREVSAYKISDVIVAQKGSIKNEFMEDDESDEDDMNLTLSKHFRIEHLDLLNTSVSSDIFLNFLSTKTTKLECTGVKFQPKLRFLDILKNAPNLEIIDIDGTNIEFDNFWPDYILQFNRSQLMNTICLSLKDLNFNAESLALLMKTKRITATLLVRLFGEKIYSKQEIANLITSKFSNFFIRCNSGQLLKILLSYVSNSEGNIDTEVIWLKSL